MSQRQTKIIAERIQREFLPFVRQPSRYIGGEINQVKKDLSACEVKVALCFPDVYEVAMSYTGMAILYEVLNALEAVAAERVFAPWTDAEALLRQKQIGLFTLESKARVKDFDVVGFSLTNELCYSNVLNMLDLAGLEVRSRLRDEDDPLVIAGGGMANCCEPMAEFIDLFVLGDGEQAVVELVELVRSKKRAGADKAAILHAAAETFEWCYVPGLYAFTYENGSIRNFSARKTGLPQRFCSAVVKDFDTAAVPLQPIVPYRQAVHERVSIEIMRGCPGRCRFCQAGYCRRPVRLRKVETILAAAKACYQTTGFDTVSLLSLSTANYPHLEELVSGLHRYFRDRHVGLSVPSLRVDQQLKLLPQLVSSVRKSGLTIAVESAGERVRRVINKPLKDEDLFAAVEAAYRAGWQKLKLYFMVGLPGETRQDVTRIVDLSFELAKLRKPIAGRQGQINVAVSWFEPKAHTPFGWLGQMPQSYFEWAKEAILKRKRQLRAWSLHFKFHNIHRSILASAVGRADRRLGNVIEAAFRAGARFDLWDECFDYELWRRVFCEAGIDLDQAAQKRFPEEEILPWQHLGGPDKAYLLRHLNNAEQISQPEKQT